MNSEKFSRRGIFIVMVLGSVITSVVSTIMSTALPVIMKDFEIPASRAQLLTSIYSLVSGIMILAMAFVVKKYPTRRLFFISILLFTAGVLLCATAPNFYVMLAGRIIPILVQTVQHQGAAIFGIVIAPCALITGLFSPVTGKLYDRIGMRPLALIGCTLVLISNLWILFTDANTSSYALILPLALLGFGMAFVMMNMTTFGMARLEGQDKTDGTALMSCLRTIGGALGTAVFVSIMSLGVQGHNYTMQDVARSYLGMKILSAVALFLAIFFVKGKKKEPAE